MAASEILHGEALRAAVVPWRDEVGRADRDRLDALVRLATSERLKLSECLRAAFPDLSGKKAVAALTSFRKRINDAAAAAKPALELRFQVDTRKQSPPEERECWFTGPDPAVASAIRYSEQVTGDVEGKPLVRPLGIATTGSALAAGKRLVRFFVSYAHADRKLVDSFLSELEKQLSSAARYEYQLWNDGRILVGEGWRASIDRAIRECDFGLLLVSPAFLGRKFIREHELPHFVGERASRPVLPVGLAKVDLRHHDLRGLQEQQIFLKGEGRFFEELQGSKNKSAFAFELFTRVQERLDAFFAGPPEPELHEAIPVPEDTEHFQRTRGFSVALRDLERERREAPLPDQARDALTEIESWAVSEDAPPFFALLGEYGIGKTTTLKQLTRELLKRRKAGEDLPLPLYIDLRDYLPQTKDAVPNIEELLASIIQRSWKLRDRSVTPEAVLRLVREEGAVILFDGLDERIVHLTPDRAREFIRTLWSALPDATRPADALRPGKRRGKLLISCRSHYFRDVGSQNAMLVGEDREGLDRSKFPAFCLVPFSEEQIRSYLKSLLENEERADSTFDLIASIHNLPDLARRPYLLKLISEQIADLEDLKARGEKVNAARLYDLVVQRWLNRDDGKHQLEPAHKRRIMEELAAALWRSGSRQWEVDQLEEWLDGYLLENQALAGAYANKDRAILKEDLRTATFVLRPDTEQKHFRFAHTSLQEYFLASYLARALNDGRHECWAMPMVSDETLDFLGQILSLGQQSLALRTMEAILEGVNLNAAMVAFRYWLCALRTSRPLPSPARVNLAGADLEEWTIRGSSSHQPLDMRGANLSGIKLNRARLEDVDLNDADLVGLEARQALFIRVTAQRASLRAADFSGLQWCEGSLHAADLSGARLHGCSWSALDISEATLPEDWRRHSAWTDYPGHRHREHTSFTSPSLTVLGGHFMWLRGCAWSADGMHIASASEDGRLKIWDAHSGRCLLTFTGHAGPLRACAWNPTGERVVSASDDKTLKIWDLASGQCVFTMRGHTRSVRGCSWSHDGKRIVSSSIDNTLVIWDAMTGRSMSSLLGHSRPVWACDWSPDDARIVSGALEELKVWDSEAGRCVATLQGHSDFVGACAWSPGGQHIASGSDDGSVRIWDVGSGQCVLRLDGHKSVVRACAWSPDGKHLVSSSVESVRVWDGASGRCLQVMRPNRGFTVGCSWSPDGQRIVSASDDRSLIVWDVDSGRQLFTFQGSAIGVGRSAWSPAGGKVAAASGDNAITIWDARTGSLLHSLRGHFRPVRACAWSPDGKRVVTGSDDRTMRVWDAYTGECVLTVHGHSGPVLSSDWSPDGKRIMSGSEDRTVKLWDAISGQHILTLPDSSGYVRVCQWSPDGERIVSDAGDNTLLVSDANSGTRLLTLKGHTKPVAACSWSPDGERLASGSSDNTLRVWEVGSRKCLLTLWGHSNSVRACRWSPDGRRLVSGSDDTSLRVWLVQTGECLGTLTGHSGPVGTCGWSPDGQRLVSGSLDNTLKIWDVASGDCLWTGHFFPEGQAASIDEVNQRVLHASPEAWRWLGWRVKDPEAGRLRIFPYEAFDSL